MFSHSLPFFYISNRIPVPLPWFHYPHSFPTHPSAPYSVDQLSMAAIIYYQALQSEHTACLKYGAAGFIIIDTKFLWAMHSYHYSEAPALHCRNSCLKCRYFVVSSDVMFSFFVLICVNYIWDENIDVDHPGSRSCLFISKCQRFRGTCCLSLQPHPTRHPP